MRFQVSGNSQKGTPGRVPAIAGFFFAAFAVLLLSVVGSSATSVVVRAESDQIFIAADTLASRRFTAASGPYDTCKIVALGNTAFAVAGNIDYRPTEASDRIPTWDARIDARQVLEAHPGDLNAAADEWAYRATAHYAAFYAADAARVRELAHANSQHVLVLGTFTGWEGNARPTVIFEWVYLDSSKSAGVATRKFVLPSRARPYTTNALTQELIEGGSPRTLKAESDWRLVSEKFPLADRSWRWLEFLIESTAEYDPTVGQHVNILELGSDGTSHWLQDYGCQQAQQALSR